MSVIACVGVKRVVGLTMSSLWENERQSRGRVAGMVYDSAKGRIPSRQLGSCPYLPDPYLARA